MNSILRDIGNVDWLTVFISIFWVTVCPLAFYGVWVTVKALIKFAIQTYFKEREDYVNRTCPKPEDVEQTVHMN